MPTIIGRDPSDHRRIALNDLTDHDGRRVISLEIGTDKPVELERPPAASWPTDCV